MLDHGPRWAPPPDWATVRVSGRGLEIRPLGDLRLVVISGDLAAGLQALCPGARLKGPHDAADGEPYAVRTAADRALLVAARLEAVPIGHSAWDTAGFASTDVGAGMISCSVTGPHALALLARGTGVDLMAPPPPAGGAAAMLLAGTRVIAYRHRGGLRLHVDRAMAPHLWRWMEVAAEALG
jgi:sarcosine oxidase gamma subunit